MQKAISGDMAVLANRVLGRHTSSRSTSTMFAIRPPPAIQPLKETTMPQFAMITGDVTYTPGDGVPIGIPRVRVEVVLAFDSATLSWEEAPGIAAVTAIPLIQFEDYVREGQITWTPQ